MRWRHFFFGTNGDTDWLRKDKWLNGAESECNWLIDNPSSSQCNQDGQVSELNFVGNNITGSLVPEVALLSKLRVFIIDNSVSPKGYGMKGGIPKEFKHLENLEFLKIVGNSFTQSLPDDLFEKWVSTTIITLGQNQIPGPIPSSVISLRSAVGFSMPDNKLTGAIPWQILGMRRSLQLLMLNNNQLQGNLPTQIAQLTLLKGLHLQENQLTGPFPNIAGMNQLQTGLDLSNNNLSGPISRSAFANSQLLRILRLSNNMFLGPMPDLSPLNASIKDLYLNGNPGLVGTVPDSICTTIASQNGAAMVDCASIVCKCCCS